jgi:transcriptional regulator with XRE-family HTH domain
MLTARQIFLARCLLGWSRQQLAERSGLMRNTIFRAETGDPSLRQSTLAAIARSFEDEGLQGLDDEGEGVALRLSHRFLLSRGLEMLPDDGSGPTIRFIPGFDGTEDPPSDQSKPTPDPVDD